jgi:hypothetical protein
MADNRSAKIAPGFGGMNSESSPEYVPPTQAAVLENLLPRPGKVVLRGPLTRGIALGLAPAGMLRGALVLRDAIRIGATGGQSKDVNSGVVSAGPGGSGGERRTTLGLYAYAVRPSGLVDIVRWDGTAGALVALTNGPADAVDITTHLARLFTISAASVLNWSDQGGSPANLATDWQDDVSGLTNQIIVGGSDDDGVALGHVGKQLAVLKDRSIWLLAGLTPSSFAVHRVTSEWGCLSAESVVDHDDGCYFLSERGFAYFDGSQVVDVSTDIKAELLTALRTANFPYTALAKTTAAKPFARAAAIGRDCIMLTVGTQNNTTELLTEVLFCGIYDAAQRTWTRFSSDAFAAGAPVQFISTAPTSFYSGATFGYDGLDNLIYLDDLASPESATTTGEDVVDGTTDAIPAVSYSRIIELSSPARASQLQRLHFDYSFVVVSDADSTVDGWSVSLVDGQGNVVLAPTSVQATVLASGYTTAQRQAALVRKRFQVEVFTHTSEVQLRITLPSLDSDVTELVAAEIHDAYIEFAPARGRPTS